MKTINQWSEIPDFETEQEENEFWQQHQLAPLVMQGSIHAPDSRESTTVTLRFDPRMIGRIKMVARSRFLNYQSMIKQWLSERLEEELNKTRDRDR